MRGPSIQVEAVEENVEACTGLRGIASSHLTALVSGEIVGEAGELEVAIIARTVMEQTACAAR